MSEFKNKIILITGGTGSFGRAFLNYLLKHDFKEVRIFSRDELKQEQMRLELNNPKVKFYIGDIRDRVSVDNATKGVDFAFHAAALKQVPSCEFFPMQAVLSNVIGSNNVIESCVANKVSSLVMLSTDKSVYPINTMGISKALMEKVAQGVSRSLGLEDTVISCVRYGNVMNSRGSVIPLFIQQINDNKPITVTAPEMTRFLLPLSTAIELVVFALAHAKQGDIFIRKAPACSIIDLVTALQNIIRSNVPVKIIGMRHGEKLHETLASREELVKSEDLGDYLRIRMDDRDLNYDKYFTEGSMNEAAQEDYTSHNTRRLTVKEVENLLLSIPEIMNHSRAAAAKS